MAKITVVHLSDIHIREVEDPEERRLRESLIRDVQGLIDDSHIVPDIVAMTGDVVDRGGGETAFQTAHSFFSRLLDVVGLDKERLFICPGNHDARRTAPVQAIVESIEETALQDKQSSCDYWETLESRFSQFAKFRSRICTDDSWTNGVFGGSAAKIQLPGGSVKLYMLNTSWASVGEADKGSLMVGRWQLEDLMESDVGRDRVDLCLALQHHPLDWLKPSEAKLVEDFLKDRNGLDVVAMLHGHIHQGQIESKGDPDGSLITLVSGIGYPDIRERERGRPKVSGCRYAVYEFDLEKKEIQIRLRISRHDGAFVADTRLYRAGSENGQFSIPYGDQWRPGPEVRNTPLPEVPEADPVPAVTGWAGRQKELSMLDDPQLRAVAITGVGGQGKSWLAAEYFGRSMKGPNSRFQAGAWVNCRELPHSLHTKLIEVMDVITHGIESTAKYREERLPDTLKRFQGHLRQKQLLLVFDNVDAYVDGKTEGPNKELLPLVNAVLDAQHEGLVIFTCRPPLTDSRPFFRHIPLTGLAVEDAEEFFRGRDIELTGENDAKYCRQLVEMTNGHPWWLGLIAGQVRAGQDTIKSCIGRLAAGEHYENERVREYFSDVWAQLSKDQQKILRYLVEAPRPLSDLEISQAIRDFGIKKLKRNLRRLVRLGLLDPHQGQNQTSVYQVHPLIREYVHKSYTSSSQRPYVTRILHVFLPAGIVQRLFSKSGLAKGLGQKVRPGSLADSIETCLNSRNELQALDLLEGLGDVMLDSGNHHRFLSLACRTLDEISWSEVQLVEVKKHATFLSNTIANLDVVDEASALTYLRKYESSVESNTLAHLRYLDLAAFVKWQSREPEIALELVSQYHALSKKLDADESIHDVRYTEALALRDSGKPEAALKIFQSELQSRTEGSAADFGNVARCYMMLKRYDQAQEYLRKSLHILLKKNDYHSMKNRGYAYLWIAEVIVAQNLPGAELFELLTRVTWGEYAPVLLTRISNPDSLVVENEIIESTLLQARELEKRFLDGEFPASILQGSA